MSDFSVNPIKLSIPNENNIENQLNYISKKIKSTKYCFCCYFIMHCFFLMWMFFKIDSLTNLSACNKQDEPVVFTPMTDAIDVPDVSTSNAKHVVNLLDFTQLDDDSKDDIFNNLDSIIVTDDDVGTSRHQISKVSWLFDEADTMLLYSSLGEVFALASNGTIAEYNPVNNARRLLQISNGWLEGKVSDVIHYGNEKYNEMRQTGRQYLKRRNIKKSLRNIDKQLEYVSKNVLLNNTDISDNEQTEFLAKMVELEDQKNDMINEASTLPNLKQNPIESKTLEDFVKEQEIKTIAEQIEQEKYMEIKEFKNKIEEEKEEVLKMLNNTETVKEEEMDIIKSDIDTTKIYIKEARELLQTLLLNETDLVKREKLISIKEQLIDSSGKLSLTQLQINEQNIDDKLNLLSNVKLPIPIDTKRPPSPVDLEDTKRPPSPVDLEDTKRPPSPFDIEDTKRPPSPVELEDTKRPPIPVELEDTKRPPIPVELEDTKRPPSHVEFENEEIKFVSEETLNIEKECMINQEQNICICTDKISRTVSRC